MMITLRDIEKQIVKTKEMIDNYINKWNLNIKRKRRKQMNRDKFIITLIAKYPRFEGVTIEEAITQIKEGIEEICGEIFEVEVKKDV